MVQPVRQFKICRCCGGKAQTLRSRICRVCGVEAIWDVRDETPEEIAKRKEIADVFDSLTDGQFSILVQEHRRKFHGAA